MPTHVALTAKLVPWLRSSGLDPDIVAWFTSSTAGTVMDWLSENRNQPPRGERLHRLWYLMMAVTGDESELNRVPEFGRYLGTLMAYGIITMQEAMNECGTTHPQAVLEIVRGTRQPMPSRIKTKVETLREVYDEGLATAKQTLKQKLATSQPVQPAQSPKPTPRREEAPPRPSRPPVNGKVSDAFLLEAARDIITILPLVNSLLNDCTPEERARFRGLVSSEALFVLSTRLNQLCSERAKATGEKA